MLNSGFVSALRESLAFVVSDPDAAIKAITDRYSSARTLLAADFEMLSDIPELGEQGAYFIRVAFALAARRVTDGFRFGRAHTEEEILDYFKALFLTETDEAVYCMFFDEAERPIACEFINEGTVSTASVLPRKILEVAIKKRAAGIIIAHNHPAGVADTSIEDITATERISSIFRSSGKRVICHYVISGDQHSKIDCQRRD